MEIDIMNDMFWDYDEEEFENSNLKKAIDICRKQNDNVNHPNHYTNGGVECIDAMKASMSETEFKGYLKGNIIKYVWRYDKKNGKEDLEKAKWYINKLIEQL